MSARSSIEPVAVRHAERSRHVWVVIALATVAFVLLCGAAAGGVSAYLGNVTVSKTATLEARGPSLVVQRNHSAVAELVTGTTTVSEGDTIQTRSGDAAFLHLFDDSTIQAYFDTRLTLEQLRTTQFFQHTKEISIRVDRGTAVIATGAIAPFTDSRYSVVTGQAQVDIEEPNTKLWVRVENSDSPEVRTEIVVDAGRATMRSHGRRIELRSEQMAWVRGNASPEGPAAAETNLVQNGDFKQPATSPALEKENGGLGVAAWLPLRDETSSDAMVSSSVVITGEELVNVQAAVLTSDGATGHYARPGIVQEINKPVGFMHQIELTATIKLVSQGEAAGGPRGDVYPLTIRVTYSDADGRPHDWKRSFYFEGSDPEAGDTTHVRMAPGKWISTEQLKEETIARGGGPGSATAAEANELFMLKSPTKGQDISVIHSIEVYGYGTDFQSWVTAISLMAR